MAHVGKCWSRLWALSVVPVGFSELAAAAQLANKKLMIAHVAMSSVPCIGFVQVSGLNPSMMSTRGRSGLWNHHISRLRAGSTFTPAAVDPAEVDSASSNASDELGSGESNVFNDFASFLFETQENICREAASSDGRAKFCVDKWERDAPSHVSMSNPTSRPSPVLLRKCTCVLRGDRRSRACIGRLPLHIETDLDISWTESVIRLPPTPNY